MPDYRLTPLDSKDDQAYRYSRDTWMDCGIDNWVQPPAQNPDMMLQLLNVLPPISGSLQRRWGYREFKVKMDFGATPTDDSLNG